MVGWTKRWMPSDPSDEQFSHDLGASATFTWFRWTVEIVLAFCPTETTGFINPTFNLCHVLVQPEWAAHAVSTLPEPTGTGTGPVQTPADRRAQSSWNHQVRAVTFLDLIAGMCLLVHQHLEMKRVTAAHCSLTVKTETFGRALKNPDEQLLVSSFSRTQTFQQVRVVFILVACKHLVLTNLDKMSSDMFSYMATIKSIRWYVSPELSTTMKQI